MPIIHIDMLPARSSDQKRNLIRKVTQAVSESLDIAPDHVTVLIREVDLGDWARGGVTFAERPPGP